MSRKNMRFRIIIYFLCFCVYYITMNEYVLHFSTMIKELRLDKKLTQTELANILGVAQSTIARLEKGVYSPDLLTLIAYAKYFKVSIDDLLGWN